MKKVKLSILALLAIAAVAPSCKKGEEDPGLSLRSRKARLAGEWKITDDVMTSKTVTDYVPTDNAPTTAGAYSETSDETYTISGGSYSIKSNGSSTETGSTATTESYNGSVVSYTFAIEKDGTFKMTKETKLTSYTDDDGDTYTIDYSVKTESEGTWQFLGKNKSLEEKKGESVLFSTTKETTTSINVTTGTNAQTSTKVENRTYGQNENTMFMHITQLKNKEIKADFEVNNTSATTTSIKDAAGTESYNYDINEYQWYNYGVSKSTQTGTGTMTMSQE